MVPQAAISVSTVIIAVLCGAVFLEPVCKEATHLYPQITEITCADFNNPEELLRSIPRNVTQSKLWLDFTNTRVEYYPPGMFAGTNASLLKFKNAQVLNPQFTKPGGVYNPFEGLEDSVETIDFADNSTLPTPWATLSLLRKLGELRLFNLTNLNLTEDFNQLPKTLTHVAVIRSTINRVDDGWLASLLNLEKVSILKCNLLRFSRSMLPRPAPRLWRLTLE